jgi:hypothetical protein
MKTKKNYYLIPVSWTMEGQIEVKADSLGDALLQARDVALPSGYYKNSSYTVDVNEAARLYPEG